MDVTFQTQPLLRLFWAVVAAFLLVVFLTGDQADPGVAAAALVLCLVSLVPLYLWMAGRVHGLPLWPVFAAVNGLAQSALPVIQNSEALARFSPGDIMVGTLSVAGFIGLGTVVWLAMGVKIPRAPKSLLMIRSSKTSSVLLSFLVFGLVMQLNNFFPVLWQLGNLYSVLRGLTSGLTTLALFALFYSLGRGQLGKAQTVGLAVLFTSIVTLELTTLYLQGFAMQCAVALLGYSLARGKVPWLAVVGAFVVLAVLHPGKSQMRATYWSWEAGPTLGLADVPAFYGEWISSGLAQIGGLAGITNVRLEGAESDSFLERAGAIHILLTAQTKSPREVPFFNGLTYELIPRLLVPRFIDPEKGIVHQGNFLLSYNYGLVSEENMRSTNIFWGVMPEAYANFGYLGMAFVAVLMAAYFSVMARLTVGVPMLSLRFAVGLVALTAAVKTDTMALFVTQQFQAIMAVIMASLVLMKRQPNPVLTGQEKLLGQLQAVDATSDGGQPKWAKRGWVRHEAGGGRRSEVGDQSSEGGVRQEARGMGHEVDGGQRSEIGDRSRAERTKDGPEANRLERSDSRAAGWPEGEIKSEIGERLAADGGVVRTMPIRMPKRIASWMPRRVRQQVAAEQRAAQADGIRHEANGGEQEPAEAQTANGIRQTASERPRQVAVPYQNYRRYRG